MKNAAKPALRQWLAISLGLTLLACGGCRTASERHVVESQINAAMGTQLDSTSWLRRNYNSDSRATAAAAEIQALVVDYNNLLAVATITNPPGPGAKAGPNGAITGQLADRLKAKRNQIVYAMLAHVRAYHESNYDDLYEGVSFAETVSDFAVLGLGGAGTLASESGSRIMSAISAGVVGARSSLRANYFNDLNKFTLITRMKAMRLQKKLEIEKKLKEQDCTAYPLDEAVMDVQDLLEDGSLRDAAIRQADIAVQDLSQVTAEEKKFSTNSTPVAPVSSPKK